MVANPSALDVIPLQFKAVIRPATENDLLKLEWFGQYWRYREIFQRTFQEQERGRRLMLVADVNDFPVGQVFIQFESVEARFADGDQRAYLYSLRVLEPFQRRGLGTQLIQSAETAILARDYHWSTIAVAKDNPGARRLYERVGYQVFDDDPGKWSYTDPKGKRHFVHEPAWILHKRLG